MPPTRNLEAHLRKGEVATVYSIISTESLLTSEAVAALRGIVLTAAPDFNRDEFRVGDQPIDRVVEAAKIGSSITSIVNLDISAWTGKVLGQHFKTIARVRARFAIESLPSKHIVQQAEYI